MHDAPHDHDPDPASDPAAAPAAYPPPTVNADKTEGTAAGLRWVTHHPEAAVRLAQGRKVLVSKFPYFGSDVWTLQPVFVEGLGTFGVTARRTLMVDPAVLTGPKAWTAAQVAAVLVHELYHLFNDHSRRADRIVNVDRKVWNIAADCEINDDLADHRNGLDLPGDYMLPQKFNLAPHQLAEVYYDALKAQGHGGAGCPQCGGAAGNPGDGPGGQDRGSAVGAALDRIFGRSDAQLQADRLATAEAMTDCASKSAGTVPDGALRRAMDLRKPPQVRWQDKLAKTMRRGIADRPGSKIPSYRRVSKITSGLGWGPGKAVLPAARDVQARVWFAIDTSGSMSPEELGIGLVECMGIIRTQGVKATFLACDADVHVVKDVNAGTDLTKLLKGGGGTDFRPVFDRYLATPVRDRPCLLVFFTDGYGCAPETPPDVPVVWLITPNGVMPAKWGEEIKIKLPTATGAQAA